MKIYDISPLLHAGVAVWPGDTKFSRTEMRRLSEGASVNLSSVILSLHTGSHVDAPSHFLKGGKSIDQVDLESYIGRARLVTLAVAESLGADDVAMILQGAPERLLVRCNPGIGPDQFPQSFVYFTAQAATQIGAAGVKLIGTDGPSVDQIDSKDLPAHHAFGFYGTAILESLNLNDAPDGEYELIALPLKIAGGDGSPVRAILREIS